jgi:hypothetical protein
MAMTLVKRGLIGQAYQTYTTGAPSDLEAIDLGGPGYLRPYGPKLTGQTPWSLDTAEVPGTTIHFRHSFAIPGGNAAETCGCFWEGYKPGPALATGSPDARMYTMSVANGFGGGSFNTFKLNPATLQLDADQMHSLFTAQPALRTLRRHRNCFLGIAWNRDSLSAPNSSWTIRFSYYDALAGKVDLATVTGVNFGTTIMNAVYGGFQSVNGAQMAARIALPSLYSMASMADFAFPTDIEMPPEANWATPNAEPFHVSSAATGSGNGTTLETAWTTAEARSENAIGRYTVTGGNIVDSLGNVIDTKTIDGDVLDARMNDGTYRPTGSDLLLTSNNGPLRWTTSGGHQLWLTTSASGIRVKSNPAFGLADNRGSVRHTGGWTFHANAASGAPVYKKQITTDTANKIFPIAYEFDSVALADIGDERRYLAHPTAANLAAYLAAAPASPAGSFWHDTSVANGFMYYSPTGGGNPNSNGKVVEISINGEQNAGDFSGCDFWNITGSDIIIEDVVARLLGGVNNSNDGGVAGGLARAIMSIGAPGMTLIRRVNVRDGGKHNIGAVPATISAVGHTRFICRDSVTNDCRPGEYSGAGGQSILVEDAHTNGDDAHIVYRSVNITTNAGWIGQTVGHVDITQPTMLQHNDGDTATPISKMWVIDCRLPGDCEIGHVTQNLTVTRSVMGYADAEVNFRAQNTTVIGNTITARSMSLGYGANPSAAGTHTGYANKVIGSGAIFASPPSFSTNSGSVIGTVNWDGNTFDFKALTGGTTKAWWTRAGVTTLHFRGNIILLNNADLYRLIDTITPASGDTLDMKQNAIEGTDSARILVTAYAGANTKTLAQLQAGGQDTGSAYVASMGINSGTYAISSGSMAHGFVSLASVPTLALTLDFAGRQRPASGLTDAGALLVGGNRRREDGFHARMRRRRLRSR